MEIAADTLFEADHADLIDDDFKPQIAAVKLLARQMAPILMESFEVMKRVYTILEKLKNNFSDDEINVMYSFEPNDVKIRHLKLIYILTAELRSRT